MRFSNITALLVLGSLFAGSLALGCSKKDEGAAGDADVEETGIDPMKNPLKAFSQLQKAGEEMQKKAEEMQNREAVDPVKFDALMVLLPEPDGWKLDGDASGETTQMAEFKITTVKQRYSKGEGDLEERMTVTIVDGSYVPMVYAPFLMMSKFSQESTEGHSKGLKVEGQPAFEEWKKSRKSVKLSILIEDRFLVTLEGDGVKADAGRTWAGLVDLKKLQKWAKDGVTGATELPTKAPKEEEPEAAPPSDAPAEEVKREDG